MAPRSRSQWRLPRPALEGDVDRVRHLRGEFVQGQRRDETQHALRDPRRDGDEVGISEGLEGREPTGLG